MILDSIASWYKKSLAIKKIPIIINKPFFKLISERTIHLAQIGPILVKVVMILSLESCGLVTEVSKGDFYVSPEGKDTNSGTKKSPFATITKAREEFAIRFHHA